MLCSSAPPLQCAIQNNTLHIALPYELITALCTKLKWTRGQWSCEHCNWVQVALLGRGSRWHLGFTSCRSLSALPIPNLSTWLDLQTALVLGCSCLQLIWFKPKLVLRLTLSCASSRGWLSIAGAPVKTAVAKSEQPATPTLAGLVLGSGSIKQEPNTFRAT